MITKTLVSTAAVAALALTSIAPAMSAPATGGSTLTAASPVRGWSTAPVTIVAGDTWSRSVRVQGGKREVKLQVKQGGPFRTVKTYRSKSNGKLTVSRTFRTAGVASIRLVVVGEGADKDIKTKAVPLSIVAKQYAGSLGGDHTSGTRWSGQITYFYQDRDPVTNQPWNDGQVHYTPIEGSVSWQYDPSVLNGPNRRACSATPSAGVFAMDALDGHMTVSKELDPTYKAYRYDLDLSVPTGTSPSVQLTCEYLEPDPDLGDVWVSKTRPTTLQFAGESNILLTNGLSVAATGEAGRYTKTWSASLSGDINRPAEAVTNRWYWDLATG